MKSVFLCQMAITSLPVGKRVLITQEFGYLYNSGQEEPEASVTVESATPR